MKYFFWTFIAAFLISCNHKTEDKVVQENLIKDSSQLIQKTIKLDFDFKIEVGKEEDFETFKTYSFFRLSFKDKIINIDSSLTEYEFRDKLYPIVIKTGEDNYQLLFEINDRPNKNYLKRIFVANGKVVNEDKLPTFISKPIDINNDGEKEYAGFWDYSENWGDDTVLTAYNPILYYSISKDKGLVLDSSITIERNKNIYGGFFGFYYNENQVMPISVSKEFEKEIEFIENNR